MEKKQGNFQTRDESGCLNYFDTFSEAYDFAKKDLSVWKISFAIGPDRIRLVREGSESFVLEQFEEALAQLGKRLIEQDEL